MFSASHFCISVLASENVRWHQGFVLSYNTRHRTANWVCEHLSRTALLGAKDPSQVASRKHCKFKPDERFHALFQATLADYQNSGYDRGHLAAAGNYKFSQTAMCETFLLSNIAPQVRTLTLLPKFTVSSCFVKPAVLFVLFSCCFVALRLARSLIGACGMS